MTAAHLADIPAGGPGVAVGAMAVGAIVLAAIVFSVVWFVRRGRSD